MKFEIDNVLIKYSDLVSVDLRYCKYALKKTLQSQLVQLFSANHQAYYESIIY